MVEILQQEQSESSKNNDFTNLEIGWHVKTEVIGSDGREE